MAAAQLMLPANRAFDSNGFPEAGATVKLYQSGTTTPANFYADSALTIVLGSTLTANAAGRLVTVAYQDRATPFRLKVFDAAGDELDDIDPFYFGSTYTTLISTSSTNVATRTAMASIAGTAGAVVNLTEAGREGTFIFDDSDLSAEVTADTAQGIYIAPSTDTTGASGAWVRAGLGSITITDYMFGAVDGADNADAIEAWADFCWAFDVGSCACRSNGTTAREISVGTNSATLQPATGKIHFGPTIRATAAVDYMVTLANIGYSQIDYGGCNLYGAATNGAALSSRLAKVGLRLSGIARCTAIGTVLCNSFYYHGVYVTPDIDSNNYGQIPFIQASYCGASKKAGGTSALSANWSSPVQVGTSGSVTQTTTLTVDASPSTDPAGMQQVAQIASYPYRIDSIVGTTLTLSQPWLDNTSVATGTGTLDYSFGAGLAIKGSDTSSCRVNGVSATRCGFAVLQQALYGPVIQHIGIDQNVDIFLGIGAGPNSAVVGTKLISGYSEIQTGDIQIVDFSYQGTSKVEIGKIVGQGIDFTKWYKHGPRITAGNLKGQSLPEFTVAGYESKIVIPQLGVDFTATYDPPSIAAAGSASTTIAVAVGGTNGTYLNVSGPVRVTFSNSLSGLILFGSITTVGAASNTVTVTFFNPTGSAVDLASGTLTVSFLK